MSGVQKGLDLLGLLGGQLCVGSLQCSSYWLVIEDQVLPQLASLTEPLSCIHEALAIPNHSIYDLHSLMVYLRPRLNIVLVPFYLFLLSGCGTVIDGLFDIIHPKPFSVENDKNRVITFGNWLASDRSVVLEALFSRERAALNFVQMRTKPHDKYRVVLAYARHPFAGVHADLSSKKMDTLIISYGELVKRFSRISYSSVAGGEGATYPIALSQLRKMARAQNVQVIVRGQNYNRSFHFTKENYTRLRQFLDKDIYINEDPRKMKALMKILSAGPWESRADAATWLGDSRDLSAIAPLTTALQEDESEKVREKAAVALGKLTHLSAIKPLIGAMQNDESWGVRSQAAIALGLIQDVSAVPALRESLRKDKKEAVQNSAEQALNEMRR